MNPFPYPPPGLIRAGGPLSFADRGPLPVPGLAVVYATRTGHVVSLPQRPSPLDRRYRSWHQVDVNRHYDTLNAELPSLVDSMRFRAQADVVWGVTDPAMIVAHGTNDGLKLVESRILDRMRRITRRFDIDDCQDAEERLQSEYDHQPVMLPEGITVFSVVVRLHSDEMTAQFEADRRQLVRTGVTDRHEHDNVRRREHWGSELERERLAALRQIAKGEDDLLFVFLTRHPDQVATVLQMVGQRREMTQKAQLALFDKMVSEGYIQEADIEPMRRMLLQPLEQVADTDSFGLLSRGGSTPAVEAGTPPQPEPKEPQNPADPQSAPSNGVSGWVNFNNKKPGDQETS